MREPTRYGVSGGISLVAHALFVLAFALAFRVQPSLEFADEVPEWEVEFIEFDVKEIEPDKAQGEPDPDPEPPEDPPAEDDTAPPPIEQPLEPEPEAPKPPEPEPDPEPKPRFGDKKSKVGALVPPNTTWTLVLANKRIKKLPFRDAATEIMAPLRDFRLLVDDAGFNVWEDFEFVVMGSPDATDQTQAFVAVEYNFGHVEMKAGIERACQKQGLIVDWREENDAIIGEPRFADADLEDRSTDDRQFVLLPGDSVAVYVREAFVAQVVAGPDASKGKTSGNFVANISKIRRFVRAEPKAGVQLIVEDLRSMIQVGALPIEIPERAELMWEAAKNPELVIKLDFLEVEHAEGALDYWNDHLEDDLRKLGAWDVAGGFISGTTVERDERQLAIRYQFKEDAARIVLQMVAKEFGKAMRWSKKEALEAKAEREKNWELREGGKRLPSELVEPEPKPAPKPADEADSAALPPYPVENEPSDPDAPPALPEPDPEPEPEPAPESPSTDD